MSVCSLSTAQRPRRMLVERGSTAEETRRRGARRELSPVLVCDSGTCWGSLGLPCVLLSVGGQSFVAPFSTAPRGQCCVSSLDVAVGARWWAPAKVLGGVDGWCFRFSRAKDLSEDQARLAQAADGSASVVCSFSRSKCLKCRGQTYRETHRPPYGSCRVNVRPVPVHVLTHTQTYRETYREETQKMSG